MSTQPTRMMQAICSQAPASCCRVDGPKSTEVRSRETSAPVWRASAGKSSPRKNTSSAKGAMRTPKTVISHASEGVRSILSMGSSGGDGQPVREELDRQAEQGSAGQEDRASAAASARRARGRIRCGSGGRITARARRRPTDTPPVARAKALAGRSARSAMRTWLSEATWCAMAMAMAPQNTTASSIATKAKKPRQAIQRPAPAREREAKGAARVVREAARWRWTLGTAAIVAREAATKEKADGNCV